MFLFLDALKNVSSSTEYKEALAKSQQVLESSRGNLSDLKGQRRNLLLDGADQDIDKFDKEIVGVSREIERLQLAIVTLNERLAEAEAREESEDLDEQLTEARQALDRGIELIKEYGAHTTTIAEILLELRDKNKIIRSANTAASNAGREDRINMPEHVACSLPGGEYRSLEASVKLPSSTNSYNLVWPPSNP